MRTPHLKKSEVKLTALTKPEKDISVEQFIAETARVSSSKVDKTTDIEKLLEYMLINKHWSPFEMVNIVFEVTTSRAIARQMLRHRSMSFQELSQRYTNVSDCILPEMRLKNPKGNRQSSVAFSDTKDQNFTTLIADDSCIDSFSNYDLLLLNGVATETARMVLPEATKTVIHCQGTLRSWLHFLDQRLSDHAQFEIREVANLIATNLHSRFPIIMSIYEKINNSKLIIKELIKQSSYSDDQKKFLLSISQ